MANAPVLNTFLSHIYGIVTRNPILYLSNYNSSTYERLNIVASSLLCKYKLPD